MRRCSIDNCDKKHYGRGLCSMHWCRQWRHGDPSLGRTPVGEPMAFIDEAVEYDGYDCLDWPYTTNKGHGRVWVDGKMQSAHRVVLERTQGPPPNADMQAAHAPVVCHNRACVNPRHLRWATVAENHADKVLDNTHRRGERTPGSKLTEDEVRLIRADRRKLREVAADYDVSEATVSLIRNRKNWAWLDDEAVAS